MNNNSGRCPPLRNALATVVGLAMVVAAAQAQQAPYPAPTQTYPAQTYPPPGQTYTAPTQTYPAQGPTNPAQYPGQTPGYPNTGYPAPVPAYPGAAPGYPGQPMPGYPQGMAPQPPQSHFFRDLFAQTIAAVLQTSTGGLLSAITGRIMEWFTRKGANPASMPAYANNGQYPQYGGTGYPGTPGYPTTPGLPTTAGYPTTPGYPATAYTASSTTPYQTPPYPAQTSSYPSPTTTYPTAAPPTGTYPQTPGYTVPTGNTAAPASYPTQPQTYPPQAQAYPSAAQPGAYPATPGYPAPAQPYPVTPQPQGAAPAAAPALIYDARTGQMVTSNGNPYATRGLGMEGALYAGIAYEVHITGADGTFSAPVNSATYDFHTGDKFMVYYRPSLPGHMEIYNINAAGKRTLIDSSNMAAGAMTGLGPYQFTNDGGDETLLLVLSPCSTPQLITTTRDIVKVDAMAAPSPQTNPIQLGSCGAPTARGLEVHTRDIEKVAVEGSTSFALDPVSPKELKSGQVTPREIPIVFHHR